MEQVWEGRSGKRSSALEKLCLRCPADMAAKMLSELLELRREIKAWRERLESPLARRKQLQSLMKSSGR